MNKPTVPENGTHHTAAVEKSAAKKTPPIFHRTEPAHRTMRHTEAVDGVSREQVWGEADENCVEGSSREAADFKRSTEVQDDAAHTYIRLWFLVRRPGPVDSLEWGWGCSHRECPIECRVLHV